MTGVHARRTEVGLHCLANRPSPMKSAKRIFRERSVIHRVKHQMKGTFYFIL